MKAVTLHNLEYIINTVGSSNNATYKRSRKTYRKTNNLNIKFDEHPSTFKSSVKYTKIQIFISADIQSVTLLEKAQLTQRKTVAQCFPVNFSKFFRMIVFAEDTEHLPIFSSNAGKYRPEKTPYLDTFYAMHSRMIALEFYAFVVHSNRISS